MGNNAVETLLREKDKLILDRDAAMARYTADIEGLEAAIALLTGKKSRDLSGETVYDDTHPDYIRQSSEEI